MCAPRQPTQDKQAHPLQRKIHYAPPPRFHYCIFIYESRACKCKVRSAPSGAVFSERTTTAMFTADSCGEVASRQNTSSSMDRLVSESRSRDDNITFTDFAQATLQNQHIHTWAPKRERTATVVKTKLNRPKANS